VIAGLDEGLAAAEAETGVVVRLILDFDRDFGAAAASEQVDQLIALRRAGAPGVERVIGVGYDSTEIGQEPGWYAAAFQRAGAAGLRRTAHQGENSGPDAIAACVDLLGAERIDHGLSILGDHDVVQRFVDEQIALTVCPSSNIRIANAFPTLAEHVYPEMRAQGLLATLNTDDPALTDLDIGREYRHVAAAFGWGWDEMVDIALDGVAATWLPDDEKAALRARTERAREDLRPR
jgi:adenosine deaminase